MYARLALIWSRDYPRLKGSTMYSTSSNLPALDTIREARHAQLVHEIDTGLAIVSSIPGGDREIMSDVATARVELDDLRERMNLPTGDLA